MLPIMIAVVALLLVSQFFLYKNKPSAPTGGKPPEPATSAPATTPEAAVSPTESASAPGAAPVKTAAAESETVVENELYRIVFTNREQVI